MLATRQQTQASPRLFHGLGLGQDAPPNRHHGVSRYNEHPRDPRPRRLALLNGEPERELAGPLVAQGRLVDVSGGDPVRNQADLAQQVQPSRARAGKRKPRTGRWGRRHLKR